MAKRKKNPESEYQVARILESSDIRAGTEASADAVIGATVLSVYDASDFDESGGQLEIDTVIYTYVSANLDLNTITLAGPGLTADVPADEQVYTYPASTARETLIQLDDSEDAVPARVPYSMLPAIDQLVRDGVEEEVALVRFEDSEWVLKDLIGEQYKFDGRFISPGTLPGDTPEVVPPTSSPTPTVNGGIAALYISVAVDTTIMELTHEVHLSTVSGFEPVLGGPTKVTEFNSTFIMIDKDPNGVPLNDLAVYPEGTVFYIRILSYNSAGSADPGGEVGSPLRRVDSPDIASNAAWIGTMTVDHLIGGNLTAQAIAVGSGGLSAKGAAGEEVALRGSGFKVAGPTALGNPTYIDFPTDGTKPNIISGTAKMNTVEIDGDPDTGKAMSLLGFSELGANAELRISSSVQASVGKPTVASEYPEFVLSAVAGESVPAPDTIRGSYYDTTANLIYFCSDDGLVRRIHWCDRAGVIQGSKIISSGNAGLKSLFGLTKIGTTWYLATVYWIAGTPFPTVVKYDDTFTTQTGTMFPSSLNLQNMFEWTVGNDGTNLFIVYRNSGNDDLEVRRFTPSSTGATAGTLIYTLAQTLANWSNTGSGGRPMGFLAGNFDFGSARYVIVQQNRVLVLTSAAARVPLEEWPVASKVGSLVWDGTRFWSVSREDSILQEYSQIKWTSEPDTWWLGVSKYNSAGPYETPMGNLAQFTMLKRAMLKITISFGGATGARAYIGRDLATPPTTEMWRIATFTAPVTAIALDTLSFSGSNPPTTNTFPANVPAQIISTTGRSFWKGDDTAQFFQMVLWSTVDAATSAGNMPPLRIGDTAAQHLRVDGNELLSMSGDSTLGRLGLQGRFFSTWDRDRTTVTTDGNGEVTISHGCGVTPELVLTQLQGSANTVNVIARTSTNFSVRITNDAGANVTGASRTLGWLAVVL